MACTECPEMVKVLCCALFVAGLIVATPGRADTDWEAEFPSEWWKAPPTDEEVLETLELIRIGSGGNQVTHHAPNRLPRRLPAVQQGRTSKSSQSLREGVRQGAQKNARHETCSNEAGTSPPVWQLFRRTSAPLVKHFVCRR